MYMYLLFLVVVTLASWYFVILCIRCIVAVLTKVFTLAFKKNECELLGNIHSRRYVLGSVFVYILTCACHLSCLLLNLVSDVHLKFKGIKTYMGSFISLVFKLKWYFRLPFLCTTELSWWTLLGPVMFCSVFEMVKMLFCL